MTQGYMPNRLPPSCLTMAPRFDTKMSQIARRGPLQEINKEPGIKTKHEKKFFDISKRNTCIIFRRD